MLTWGWQFDIDVHVSLGPEAILVNFGYWSTLMSDEQAQRLASVLDEILVAITKDEKQTLAEIVAGKKL